MVRSTIKRKDAKFLGGLKTSYFLNVFNSSLGQTKPFCNYLITNKRAHAF